MSQTSNLTAAFQRVRDEFNTARGLRGDLTSLDTTAKGSLVAALNELHGEIDAIDLTNLINDAAASTASTYSSTKITADIDAAVAALVDSAPGALDTLNELATAITGNDADIVSILADIASNDTDIAAAQTDATQALADATAADSKAVTAQSEIDALEIAVGDTNQNFVTDFTTGLN